MDGIHWGDLPAWIALCVSIVGGTVTFIQKNVLKSEVQRNKERDELLHRQIHELEMQQQERSREQAENVTVVWDPPPRTKETTTGKVINESRRPIFNIAARVEVPLPDGSAHSCHGGPWTFFFGHGHEEPVPAESGALTALKPGASGECSFSFPHYGDRDHARLVVRFNDDAKRRWQLNHYMHLEPAPDDRW